MIAESIDLTRELLSLPVGLLSFYSVPAIFAEQCAETLRAVRQESGGKWCKPMIVEVSAPQSAALAETNANGGGP